MSFVYVANLAERDIPGIMKLYSQAWWTRDRNEATVRQLMRTSSIFAGIRDCNGSLVACIRILSDEICKALIMDLIVDNNFRRQGLAAILAKEVSQHPRLRNVADIELYCEPSLVKYYEKLGFRTPGDTKFMRRTMGAKDIAGLEA